MEDETHQPRRRGRPPLPPLAGREGKRNRVPERTALFSAIAEQLLAAGESMSDFCRDRLGIPESRFRAAANGRSHLSPRITEALATAIGDLGLDVEVASVFLDPAKKHASRASARLSQARPSGTSTGVSPEIIAERAKVVRALRDRLEDPDIRLSQFCPSTLGICTDHFLGVARGKKNGLSRLPTIALGRALKDLGLDDRRCLCFLNPLDPGHAHNRASVLKVVMRHRASPFTPPPAVPSFEGVTDLLQGWLELGDTRARINLTIGVPYQYSVRSNGVEVSVSVVARELWPHEPRKRVRATRRAPASADSAPEDAPGLKNSAPPDIQH